MRKWCFVIDPVGATCLAWYVNPELNYGCEQRFETVDAARCWLYRVQRRHKLASDAIEWVGITPPAYEQLELF